MKIKQLLMNLLILGSIVVLIGIVLTIKRSGQEERPKVKMGFIMTGTASEEGWNQIQHDGVKAAADHLNMELFLKENVQENTGQCKEAVLELIHEGVRLIVLDSFGYAEEVKDEIKNHPEVVFYNNSTILQEANVTTYFVRMYQVRFLSGIIAGLQTKTDKIGYVAAMSNVEVNRGINAFTLGVQRMNPKAKVYVRYTGDWDDETAERNAARELAADGCDLLTYHQNRPNVVKEAERLRVYSIGCYTRPKNMSSRFLTAALCDWSKIYEVILKEYLQGEANDRKYVWIGIEEQAVMLDSFSDEVSQEARLEVEKAIKEFTKGKDVFSGKIYDTQGRLQCDDGEIISDERLLMHCDWLVKGVVIQDEK